MMDQAGQTSGGLSDWIVIRNEANQVATKATLDEETATAVREYASSIDQAITASIIEMAVVFKKIQRVKEMMAAEDEAKKAGAH